MRYITISLIILTLISCNDDYNEIVTQLEIMEIEDQKWRVLLQSDDNGKRTDFDRVEIIERMNTTDSLNGIRLIEIFNNYGFINYYRFGKNTSNRFCLLVQHQDNQLNFQREVLKKMKVAVENNDASPEKFAYLTDRVRINNGLQQIYGTQMMLNSDKSSFIPKPTENIKKLNSKRASIGLEPIEEYINLMNKEYYGILRQ